MELSPSWEATNRSATQEFPNIYLTPKVHFRVHKSPPLVPILSQMNPVHTTSSYLSKFHFNLSSYLHLRLPSGLFPSDYPTKILYAFFFPMRATALPISSSSTWLFWLYLVKSIVYEAPPYAVFSNFILFYPSSVHIFSSAPCSQTPSVYVPPLMSDTKFHTHTKTTGSKENSVTNI
jgi:hypothetical protein